VLISCTAKPSGLVLLVWCLLLFGGLLDQFGFKIRADAGEDRAYKNFFVKSADLPKFKRKGSDDAFRYPDLKQIKLNQGNDCSFLPKLGWLRLRSSRDVQLAAFYDVGNVQVNKFNDHPAAASPNDGTLQGAGLSLSGNGPYNVIVNATWATRIGSNPFANDASQNQDGSSSKNRFWLNASIGF
jgi:hypothetical protein